LGEASEEEEDMLDLAAGVRRTSRLACQIDLTAELDGLEVSVPSEATDARSL
jgi:ferredoxin